MSIRLLAKDFYRYQQLVDKYEKMLAAAPAARKPEIEEKLRRAISERNNLRRMLNGQLDR